MSGGWIKLHRKILDWEWYDDTPCFRVFMHLLLSANRENTKYHGHDIPAGAVVSGYPSLAAKTALTVQQTRTAIKKLEECNAINRQVTGKFSIITICNWQSYQDDNRQATGKQQASNRQVTTEQEMKNKEERNILGGASASPAKKKNVSKRETRLPDNWILQKEEGEWVMERYGWHPQRVVDEAEKFKDYWHSKAGASGVKLDWSAAWRNWIRNANEGFKK